MRKRLTGKAAAIAAAALVAALDPVVAPASAAAAAPDGPSRLVEAQECGDVAAYAARLAAAGGSGIGVCVQKREVTPADRNEATGSQTAAATCGSASFVTRSGACQIEDAILVIFLVPSGQVIGSIGYTVWGILSLNYNSLSWVQSFNYQAEYVVGSGTGVTGTQIYAEPLCLLSCTVSSSGLVGGSALPGRTHFASATFRTPSRPGQVWNAQSAWKWWFANPAWTPTTTNTLTTSPGAHRCDHTLGASTSPGCVYRTVQPVHEIGRSRYPKYAGHIRMAQMYGVPSVLTRTTNSAIIAANRATACPTGPAFPRPINHTCDEYPFSSTYEGAASQPYGRTFFVSGPFGIPLFDCKVPWLRPRASNDPYGYSVCMVPAAENSGGGSDLGNFYYQNRVIDGDGFRVQVT